jgi:hypothetical protein
LGRGRGRQVRRIVQTTQPILKSCDAFLRGHAAAQPRLPEKLVVGLDKSALVQNDAYTAADDEIEFLARRLRQVEIHRHFRNPPEFTLISFP